jgi:UDP-glucose 4-epimerase
MSILITGGAGYVGSHIALELLDTGHDVVIADNLSTGFESLVPGSARLEIADIHDRTRMAALMRAHGVKTVVHCAGSTVVPDSVHDPLGYYDNNVGGSLSLLRAMKDAGVQRLLFSSTAAVYAVSGSGPISETAPLAPASPYGASKLMVEQIIQDLATASRLKFMILRYFNVAGADALGRSGQCTPSATHLIKIASEVALAKREELEIFGTDWPTVDGTGVRDFIHVNDLAQAHRLAVEALGNGITNRIYNCGYGHGYSVRDVVCALEQVTKRPISTRSAPRRPGDLAEVVADSTALQRSLGWTPRHDDLNEILKHALAWESGV